MEVILRNNVVESARAGDEMVFVGTLLVVPDVAAITAPGEKVQTKPGMSLLAAGLYVAYANGTAAANCSHPFAASQVRVAIRVKASQD